jgi:hydroxymethylbilane synthase
MNIIRIGTRASKLAIAQAQIVKDEILRISPELNIANIEIVKIKTSGDKFLDKNLNDIGGKGLFTKEIEESLIAGDIDIAVHSVKDLPALLPDELQITAVLKREDPRDVLIAKNCSNLEQLPESSIIATSSLRRKAIIRNIRPDIELVDIRGNILTRLDKLKNQNIDAIIIAAAGMKRIALAERISQYFDFDLMLPAVGQGAIGVETLKDNQRINELVFRINDLKTQREVAIERLFMKGVDGSCRTPIASYVEIKDKIVNLRSLLIHPDGSRKIALQSEVRLNDADDKMQEMIDETLSKGSDIIDFIKSHL